MHCIELIKSNLQLLISQIQFRFTGELSVHLKLLGSVSLGIALLQVSRLNNELDNYPNEYRDENISDHQGDRRPPHLLSLLAPSSAGQVLARCLLLLQHQNGYDYKDDALMN